MRGGSASSAKTSGIAGCPAHWPFRRPAPVFQGAALQPAAVSHHFSPVGGRLAEAFAFLCASARACTVHACASSKAAPPSKRPETMRKPVIALQDLGLCSQHLGEGAVRPSAQAEGGERHRLSHPSRPKTPLTLQDGRTRQFLSLCMR